MKIEFEEIKTIKHFKVICDFCGMEKIDNWSGFGTCEICKKHGCYKCGEFFFNGTSDYHDHYGCNEHRQIIRDCYNKYAEIYESIPDIDKLISAYSIV